MSAHTPLPKELLEKITQKAQKEIDDAAKDMRIATDALIATMRKESQESSSSEGVSNDTPTIR